MNLTRILAPTAVLATLTLMAIPAHAGQHSGGHSRSGGGARAAVSGTPRGGVGMRSSAAFQRGGAVRGGAFLRPYYAFRPRFGLGFGLWAGYPVGYPYYYGYGYPYLYYGYPYSYPYPYGYAPYGYGYSGPAYRAAGGYPAGNGYPAANGSYGYPAQPAAGSLGVQPGEQVASGGVSFEITPGTAAVSVDGAYVGTVANFGPTTQPLGLTAGRHHIEVRAPGYRTIAFDTDVTPGQVVPYQGSLQAQAN